MAKKRKTKQAKVIADLRRKLQAQVVPQAIPNEGYSLTTVKPILTLPIKNPSASFDYAQDKSLRASYALKTINYSYVLSDLRKTVLLTIVALAAQAILYFVLVK